MLEPGDRVTFKRQRKEGGQGKKNKRESETKGKVCELTESKKDKNLTQKGWWPI